MNLKNIFSRIFVVAVLTVMVGFQSANAQATKTDASVQKAESTTDQILPGERHPEDIAIDKKMAAQGIQPTRISSSSTMPERHPEDIAIDKKMAVQGIKSTRTSSSSVAPERHPEDVAIDKKMAAQNPTKKQATPTENKVAEHDNVAEETEDNTPQLRHDGTVGSQPQPRWKSAAITTAPVEANEDGTVRKPGDPVQPKRVRVKTPKANTAAIEANEDGTVKENKEEN